MATGSIATVSATRSLVAQCGLRVRTPAASTVTMRSNIQYPVEMIAASHPPRSMTASAVPPLGPADGLMSCEAMRRGYLVSSSVWMTGCTQKTRFLSTASAIEVMGLREAAMICSVTMPW
jgi:hypothetical protein